MRERISKLKKKLQNQKGFTLVELMAVLAILALIVAIAVPAVGSILEKAKVSAAEANVEMVENAAELAHISGDFDGPYTAQNLADKGFLKLEPTTVDAGVDGQVGTADDVLTYEFDDEYVLTEGKSGQYSAEAK